MSTWNNPDKRTVDTKMSGRMFLLELKREEKEMDQILHNQEKMHLLMNQQQRIFQSKNKKNKMHEERLSAQRSQRKTQGKRSRRRDDERRERRQRHIHDITQETQKRAKGRRESKCDL